jgi:hypothetical protein
MAVAVAQARGGLNPRLQQLLLLLLLLLLDVHRLPMELPAWMPVHPRDQQEQQPPSLTP